MWRKRNQRNISGGMDIMSTDVVVGSASSVFLEGGS